MKDYHVHYCIDSCASNDMTFENINKKCRELGLGEITVLKHYSEKMPNGEADWICWHRIRENEWEQYLREFSLYTPNDMIIHSGVETELCNEQGDINIPDEAQSKIDMCALSVHYMIDLDCCKMDFLLYPDLNFCPEHNNDEGRAKRQRWKEKVESQGAEKMISGLVNGYINAIKRYPKIRTLAHMYDGMHPLRTYLCDVDSISRSKQVEIIEPLMKVMSEHGILWEVYGDSVVNENVLVRANELGVRFCATADGHFLDSGWGPLTKHNIAENLIDKLGLKRGSIDFN